MSWRTGLISMVYGDWKNIKMNGIRKEWAGVIFVVAAFVLITLMIYSSYFTPKSPDYSKVCFGRNCFNVEIADTAEERARGLMFRNNLGEDRGMLFIFESEGVYPFWMKNTLIPLDIIWMDSEKKIVYISRNTTPCETEVCPSYNPNKKSKYVLEINGGLCDRLKIKEGDVAVIN